MCWTSASCREESAGSLGADLVLLTVLMLVTVLLLEPDAPWNDTASYSVNQVHGCGEFWFLEVLLLLSPAGHGGEGRRGSVGVLGAEACR